LFYGLAESEIVQKRSGSSMTVLEADPETDPQKLHSIKQLAEDCIDRFRQLSQDEQLRATTFKQALHPSTYDHSQNIITSC
jgi:hypothetical protein